MKTIISFIILLFTPIMATSAETCSRIAIINHQEVLVDANSSEKGEGLRYHIEKDNAAKEYLDTYQKNSRIIWPNAFLGTTGTAMLLYGFFNSDTEDKNIYLLGGASVMLINFFVAKTLEITNESNLTNAINEYNKRNLPKIFFSPEENRSQNDFLQYRVSLLGSWSF